MQAKPLYCARRKELGLTFKGVVPNEFVWGKVCNVNIVDRDARVWSAGKVLLSVFSMISE